MEIEYAGARADGADVGAWDVFVGAHGGLTLGRGALADTGGKIRRIRADFELPPHASGEQVEIRTFFHGFGILDVRWVPHR
jgi:hypothetical protein